MGAIIVFTSKGNNELDLKGSDLPAMHFTKLKGFMRQRKSDAPLEEADYAALRAAFDEKAAYLMVEEGEETAVQAGE